MDLLEKSPTGNSNAPFIPKSLTFLSFLTRSTPLSNTFPCGIDLFHQDTEIVVTLPRTGDLDESCTADACLGMEVWLEVLHGILERHFVYEIFSLSLHSVFRCNMAWAMAALTSKMDGGLFHRVSVSFPVNCLEYVMLHDFWIYFWPSCRFLPTKDVPLP